MKSNGSATIVGLQQSLFKLSSKEAYRNIRNFLAGRLIGATRDEALLEEVIKCLFCKMQMERSGEKVPTSSTAMDRKALYESALKELRNIVPNVFVNNSSILLDSESLDYVDLQLGAIDLSNWSSDPFGDAYEAFTGAGFRGQEGQFFTPLNAVELLVSMVAPIPGERVIDPACGSGGFLSATARMWMLAGASPKEISKSICGIDKDRYLAGLAGAHVSFVTLAPSKVVCADSLAWMAENGQSFPFHDQLGTFDVVLTNPPFGSRIVSASKDVKASFDLGHRWRTDRATGRYERESTLQSLAPPQMLFIERCLSMLKPGGRLGIVIPESLISGKSYRHVVQYIRDRAQVEAIVGMPESLFKTSGKGGTHTKTCLLVATKFDDQLVKREPNSIFMAEAVWCGNDSRGKYTDRDDLPKIATRYQAKQLSNLTKMDHLGYVLSSQELVDNILTPRYYDPEPQQVLQALASTHDLIKVGDLVKSGVLEISTGHEIGKLAYGTGTIPFVRTSDISNWEIKVDPKHGVSEEIYDTFARRQDVREGDLLMVRDGTYLIGTCAFVTKYDIRMVFQSHLYKLRVKDTSLISSHLLLVALSSAPVRRQIQAKRFTQDIIDSLGDRINELILPLPKDEQLRTRVEEMALRAIQERVEARELTRRARIELIAGTPLVNDDDDIEDPFESDFVM